LEPFLNRFWRCCDRYGITSSEEQYKGLLQYCNYKVQKTLRNLPSHKQQDIDTLIEELTYFYGDDETHYNIASVEAFTTKWRHRKIITLDLFKRYHRKYLELVGEAKALGRISNWDYDRYFWEGLNESFRHKVENRMLATHPNLDVSTPFSISKIVKGAEYILSPYRFDQHLQSRSNHHSSETESEPERPIRCHKYASDSSSEDSSEDDEKPLYRRKTRTKEKSSHHHKSPPRQLPSPPPSPHPKKHKGKQKEDQEMKDLIARMGRMDLTEAEYTSLYVEVVRKDPGLKGALEDPKTRVARKAFEAGNRFQRNNPPHHFQRDEPPHRSFANSAGPPPRSFNNMPGPPPPTFNNMSRPPPPPFNNSSGPSNQQGNPCYGCGQQGHRLSQCEEVNSYLRKGQVAKDPETGRLQWPDGSRIYRENGEPWGHAISKTFKQANFVRVGRQRQDPNAVYNYIGVARDEEDASTDEQDELGWTSGFVSDRQAYGAERTKLVSREARKKVQFDPPNIPQRVKELPRSREADRMNRQQTPVHQAVDPNSNQGGLPERLTPVDVHQDKFEGKSNDQFVPMTVDQDVTTNLGNDLRKDSTRQKKPHVGKVPNPGSIKGRDPSAIVQDILDTPVTLSLREAVGISPHMRRDLSSAVKQVREVSAPVQEKMGLVGKVVSDCDESTLCNPSIAESEEKKFLDDEDNSKTIRAPLMMETKFGAVREDLLKVPARIGHARMMGIFDSGSQVNIISQNLVEATGLPWSRDREHQLKLISVDGTVSRCAGVVPNAKILMTESKLPTYGDLYVKTDPGFELLLGRAWGTKNRANLIEDEKGSHLSFQSGTGRWGLNVCPNSGPPKQESDDEETAYSAKRSHPAQVYAIAIDDQDEEEWNASDSEAHRIEDGNTYEIDRTDAREPEDIAPDMSEGYVGELEYSPKSVNEEMINLAQTRFEQDSEDERTREREKESEEHPKGIPQAQQESHANEAGNTRETGAGTNKFNIHSELHESYIKMVQKGVSNDEWNLFCRQEEQRKTRDNQRWKGWHKDNTNKDMYGETMDPDINPFDDKDIPDIPESSPEPSHTLATIPSEPEPNPEPVPTPNPHHSVIAATRRSRREKRVSERAKGDEYKRFIRSYQRKEKQTRKIIRGNGAPVTESDFCAFAARLAPADSDSDDGTSEEGDPDDPTPRGLRFCGLKIEPEPKERCTTGVSSGEESERKQPTTKDSTSEFSADDIPLPMRTHREHLEADPDDSHPTPYFTPHSCEGPLFDSEPTTVVTDEDFRRYVRSLADALATSPNLPSSCNHRGNSDPTPAMKESIPELIPGSESEDRGMEGSSEDGDYDWPDDLDAAKSLIDLTKERPEHGKVPEEPREVYEDHGHTLLDGESENPYEDLEPLGMTYILPPREAPNGILAAYEIFPFAYNEERREHHFQAFNITLATEGWDGNNAYYHGHATIRVNEPEPGTTIQVPKRGRTNEMRQRMFSMGKFANIEKRTKIHRPQPAAQEPGEKVIEPCEMSRKELEAVVVNLIEYPMQLGDDIRNYTITKTLNGCVKVRLGWDPDVNTTPGTQTREKERLEERDEQDLAKGDQPEKTEQKALTQNRNDPHTSDQAPGPARHVEQEPVLHEHAERPTTMETNVQHENYLERGEESENGEGEGAETIKGESRIDNTHLIEIEPQVPDIATTNSHSSEYKSMGCKDTSLTVSAQPNAIHSPDKTLTSHPTTDFPNPQDMVNVPPVVVDEYPGHHPTCHDVPPPPHRNPGILTAAHVVALKDQDGPPQENSYFAYGVSFVDAEGDLCPSDQGGTAFIRLYNLNSDSRLTLSHPHLEEDTLGVLASEWVDGSDGSFHNAGDVDEFGRMMSYSTSTESLGCPKANLGVPPFVPKVEHVRDENGNVLTMDEAIAKLRVLCNDVDVSLCAPVERLNKNADGNHDNPPLTVDPRLLHQDPPPSKPVETQAVTIDPIPDPLPHLFYPDEQEPKAPVMKSYLAMTRPADDVAVLGNDKPMSHLDSGPRKTLRTIVTMDDVMPAIEHLEGQQETTVFESLAELGLLQITYDIGRERDEGRELDAKYWTQKIDEALKDKDESKTSLLVKWIRKRPHDTRKSTPDNLPTPKTSPIPIPPSSRSDDWDLDAPPYRPTSPEPGEIVGTPYVPQSPGRNEFDEIRVKLEELGEGKMNKGEFNEIQERIWFLEQRVETTTFETKEKIRELEAQLAADSCEITNMKWNAAGMRKLETQTRTNPKKTNRRNNRSSKNAQNSQNAQVPPLRGYATRAVVSAVDEALEDVRREIAAMTDRIRKAEDRVEKVRKEIADLQRNLATTSALAPEIEKLTARFEAHLRVQEEKNRTIGTEVNILTNHFAPGIGAEVDKHKQEIKHLTLKCQQLYTLVASSLYSSQVTAPASNYPHHVYPTPLPTPERKLIAAF
jgi:hypothetical protein